MPHSDHRLRESNYSLPGSGYRLSRLDHLLPETRDAMSGLHHDLPVGDIRDNLSSNGYRLPEEPHPMSD